MKVNLQRLVGLAAAVGLALATSAISVAADKPNILVIMPDDVGWSNPSVYNMGMMGYQTPNIDRIAKEGTFDIYFGPKAPEGKENHWFKTNPGKGWFTFLRI